MFEQNRAYSDNDILEFAGKLLPAHPITRYKSFSPLWKKTRKMGGHVPRPSACSADEDFIPCCLRCVATPPDRIQETLAWRSASQEWLTAEWVWDFGFTLPPELISLWSIGIAIPEAPIQYDRVFLLTPDNKRSYLKETLQEHAQLKSDQLHEAKIAIVSQPLFSFVAFPGQIIASVDGQIFVAQSRLIPLGKEISERYIFQAIQMSFSNLEIIAARHFAVKNAKLLFNGIELN
ncbi:MAG TPA: hypothetical protein V6D31_10435 [Candidatus Sericytochromatia bacterium]